MGDARVETVRQQFAELGRLLSGMSAWDGDSKKAKTLLPELAFNVGVLLGSKPLVSLTVSDRPRDSIGRFVSTSL